MYAIYAFMRHTDDLADSFGMADARIEPNKDITRSEDSIGDRLVFWRKVLNSGILAEQDPTAYKLLSHQCFPNDLLLGFNIIPAILDSTNRFQIPHKYLFTVLDGVEMDLTKNRFQPFEELELYCERVASAVGLACIHIWGFEGRGMPEEEVVYELARKVGIAYQLTNILRDVKEDAAMDRVYLPLDEISAAGYTVEELKNGVVNAAFDKLMQTQLARAEDYYRASRELYARLKPEGKKIFGLMTATYHAILKRIAADPAVVFTKRIRPGKFERIRLVVKWTCSTPKELLL